MISTPVYVTREMVKEAPDFKETARNNPRVDQAIMSSAVTVDGCLHRRFYPEFATRKWDWPNASLSPSWELELGDNDLISITTLTAGGTVIPAGNYKLLRGDNKAEPPYNRIQIDLSTASAFAAGPTWQESIVIEGLWGYSDNQAPAGATAQSINGSVTSLNVTNSAILGVGSLIKIDTERLLVTDKRSLDTAQNLQVSLTANQNNQTVAVQDGTTFFVGEVILIDAERMKIYDIAGNNLFVIRAWDGTALAAHTAPTADIFAPRTLTVTRAFVGSTAASHNNAVSITQHVPHPLATEFNFALALNNIRTGIAGYTPDMFDNKALNAIADRAYTVLGRKLRSGAI